MFNIQKFVNKITDKGNSSRPGESSATVLDSEGQHSAEGFLCPPCMKAFPSPEALEEHYLKAHPMESETLGGDGEIQVLRQEIEILQSSLVEEKSMSEELKKEVLKIQSEISKKESDKGASTTALEESNSLLKSEVTLLRQQLTDELEHTSGLRKEKELFKEKLLALAAQNDALVADNKSLASQLQHRNSVDDAAVLRQELVSVQRLMDQLTLEKEKEAEDLNVKLKQLEQTLESKLTREEELLRELAKTEEEHDQLIKYTDEIYQLKRDLADLMATKMKSDSELDNAREEVQKAQKQISTLEAQNQLLLEEKKKLETSEVDNSSGPKDVREDSESLKAEIETLRSQNNELSQNLRNLKLKIEKSDTDVAKLMESHAAERKHVEVKFGEYEAKLKEKVDDLRKKENERSEILTQKDAAESKLREELTVLQNHVDDGREMLKSLQLAKESLEAKQQSLEKEHADLIGSTVQLKGNLKTVEEKCFHLERERTSFEKQVTELNGLVAQLEEKHKNLEVEHSALLQERNQLKEGMEEVEAKLIEEKKLANAVQTERDELRDKLTNLEELSAHLTQENSEKQTEISKLSSDIGAKSEIIVALENSVKKAQECLEEQKGELTAARKEAVSKIDSIRSEYESQLSALKIKMDEGQAEVKKLEESLNGKVQEISDIRTLVADAEAFASETTMKFRALETRVQELEVLNDALKCKLKSSEEEKALLAERCLTEQSKAEASHQAYEDCKRKLDDSVAALQELGRENQSLQIESAKLQGRKWADDSVVTNCTGCTKEFSLTIRKHHCRHCGQIFCNDCSSRTASVPSSKKPVRVCDVCYQELTSK